MQTYLPLLQRFLVYREVSRTLRQRKNLLTIEMVGLEARCTAQASEETKMGHAVRIHSREQYIQALRVLDKLPGTWQGVGPASDPVLLVTDVQYNALLEAGVVTSNDRVFRKVLAARDGS
jgi:hypothetical protein